MWIALSRNGLGDPDSYRDRIGLARTQQLRDDSGLIFLCSRRYRSFTPRYAGGSCARVYASVSSLSLTSWCRDNGIWRTLSNVTAPFACNCPTVSVRICAAIDREGAGVAGTPFVAAADSALRTLAGR
jgi:hypothetical protein